MLEVVDQHPLDIGEIPEVTEHLANLSHLPKLNLVVRCHTGEDLGGTVEPPGFSVLRLGVREQVERERDESF